MGARRLIRMDEMTDAYGSLVTVLEQTRAPALTGQVHFPWRAFTELAMVVPRQSWWPGLHGEGNHVGEN